MLAVGTTTVRVLETLARGGTARRADDAVRHAGLRVQARRRAADELPPAALDAARAGDGVRRRRADEAPLRARGRRALPLLLLRRRDADPVTSLQRHGNRRRGARRRAAHRARRRADAGVHARRARRARSRASHPDELRALGTTMLLGNTYHLHLRPGEDLIAELGGLHAFMGWDGPILTDSGGYQVFSLRHTIARVDDDGVTFRSVYDGDLTRLTPEIAAAIQRKLGSDVAMCLDQVPPPGVTRAELEDAVRRTTLWATRQRAAERAPGQLVFGDRAGPHATTSCAAARSPSSRSSTSTATRSAGSRSARTATQMLETTAWAAPLLPAEKPRYFMGIGDPAGHPRRDRARHRHVRLRAGRRGSGGPGRRSRGRAGSTCKNARFARDAAPARRALRLPGLRALLARVPAPSRQPERVARAPAAEPA